MRTMRGGLIGAAAIAVFNAAINGQVLPHGSSRTPRNADEAAYRQMQRQRDMDAQSHAEMLRAERAANTVRIPQEKFGKLTAKEKKKLEALRAPRQEDLEAYKDFLSQPKTGMVRLLPGFNCESRYVVHVDGNCVNMVPGSSFHRFREDAISGDILFMDDALIAEGFFANSIMTGLGNLPLTGVSTESPGMRYINDFVPASDSDGARKQYLEISRGVTVDGFGYSNRLLALPEMTYGLRIIAYRNGNNVFKRISREQLLGVAPSNGNAMFLALKDDTRIDLTLSFRVIRKDADGSITLIWKELSRKDSPEIIFPEDVPLADFK